MASLKEMVATYNEAAASLGRNPVVKFRDRKSAERRCSDIAEEVRKFSKKEQPMPETNGEFKLRRGTKRSDIYNVLAQNLGEPVPANALSPGGQGTDYAVKKLNEKLSAAGSPFEITRSKVEKVVYFALAERTDES